MVHVFKKWNCHNITYTINIVLSKRSTALFNSNSNWWLLFKNHRTLIKNSSSPFDESLASLTQHKSDTFFSLKGQKFCAFITPLLTAWNGCCLRRTPRLPINYVGNPLLTEDNSYWLLQDTSLVSLITSLSTPVDLFQPVRVFAFHVMTWYHGAAEDFFWPKYW